MDVVGVHGAMRGAVVGRVEEAELILAALGAGRDLLLEGPPGTSKSTILRAITDANRTPLYFVEGSADLTPAKLIGHHSPSRVLQGDYSEENFVPGPLPRAMSEGGFLYIEEFNRVPEDTLNVLITAMAERELTVPRAGTTRAVEGFCVVAAMNPFDNIGTERLSGAVADRLCRVRMDYQTAEEEREIVARRTGTADAWLVGLAVEAMRRTRGHPDLRMGASVRAAIDFVLVAERLAALRGVVPGKAITDEDARRTLLAAARTAFSIKVRAREAAGRDADDVVTEIVAELLDEQPEGEPPEDPGGERAKIEGGEDRQTAAGPGGGSGGGASSTVAAAAGGGRVYVGEEVRRATAHRPRGNRMFRSFAAEHPELVERLRHEGATDEALRTALREEGQNELEVLAEMADLYDRADLRALARRLATELIVRSARRDVGRRGDRGHPTAVRYRGEAGELELDLTLEALVERPRPRDEDLFVLERRRRRRSYALMLDISGSMKGQAIFHAALALASVAVRAGGDPFSVVAFWREAAILKHIDEPAPVDELLDRLFSLSGHGLTDLGLGLRTGLDELERAQTQERVGLLFGDGLQTTGAPARPTAAAFPTLHVLATGQGDESITACHQLAALGRGRCAVIRRAGGIAEAVNACLAA